MTEGFGGAVGVEDGVGCAGERADVDEQRGRGGVRASAQCRGEAGGGARLDEGGADGVADEIMDEGGLTKADLGLGRVDVDVDLLRGHLEEEQDDGVAGGREDIAVGLGERVEDELVADEALIDKDVDGVAIEFLQLRLGDEAGDAEVAGVGGDVVGVTLPGRRLGEPGAGEVHLGGSGKHEVEGVFAEDLEEAFASVGDGGCDEQCLCCRVELEVTHGMSEGVVGDEGGDVGELGLLGLEELATGRGIEEEVADGKGRASGKAGGFDTEDVAAGDFDQRTGFVFRAASL